MKDYDDIALHFDHTRVNQWVWVESCLKDIKDNSIVYDIGCGNGVNMKVDNHRLVMIGLDSCQKFVSICKNKNLNVVEGCMTQLPFRSKSADTILCIASFHHLKNYNDRVSCLNELNRCLKEKGEVILSVWSINQPLKTRRKFSNYGDTVVTWNKYGSIYKRYYYIFKLEEIKQLFQKCGFFIKKHTYDYGNEIFHLVKIIV